MGFQASIDGFGTGGTSFSVLKQISAKTVKLAAQLVDHVDDDPDAVATVIDLAKSLGLHVVAHGIERPAQLEALALLGCDFAQGYLLGRPQPAPELAASLVEASGSIGT